MLERKERPASNREVFLFTHFTRNGQLYHFPTSVQLEGCWQFCPSFAASFCRYPPLLAEEAAASHHHHCSQGCEEHPWLSQSSSPSLPAEGEGGGGCSWQSVSPLFGHHLSTTMSFEGWGPSLYHFLYPQPPLQNFILPSSSVT